MTNDDFLSGARAIIAIKATHEVRDESGLIPVGHTKGELVLTEKEFVFVEVRGLFRKAKTRSHAFSVNQLVGYHYERWSGGPTNFYLTKENEDGTRKNFLYLCSKRDYEKFIGKVKERKLI